MSKTVLFKKTRLGKIQRWEIWVEENGKSGFPEVYTLYGLEDGKKQVTFDVIKEGVNIGKANETTAIKQAHLTLERKVTKQREEGYFEAIDDAKEEQGGINWDNRFGKSITFYKPKNSLPDNKLIKLEKDKKALFTVKRDGFMHVVRKTEKFGVEIYSRRMDLISEKYPHLTLAFEKLPNNTILLGEIVLLDGDKDNFNGASQICRSDAKKAIEKQNELGKVSFYIFDLAFCNKQNWMTSYGYKDRHSKIKELSKICKSEYILPGEIIYKSHKEAMKEVKKRGLEGLVVWDADGKMKDNECFTKNGKSYRPNILFKSKPRYELDAIARFDPDNGIGEYGKGKNNGKMKSVFLYQLDNDGNENFISKLGGGFSDEQRDFYTTAKYPRVFEVLYDSIQVGTGSLRFPIFSRDRTLTGDKSIEECFVDEKIKKAREK